MAVWFDSTIGLAAGSNLAADAKSVLLLGGDAVGATLHHRVGICSCRLGAEGLAVGTPVSAMVLATLVLLVSAQSGCFR